MANLEETRSKYVLSIGSNYIYILEASHEAAFQIDFNPSKSLLIPRRLKPLTWRLIHNYVLTQAVKRILVLHAHVPEKTVKSKIFKPSCVTKPILALFQAILRFLLQEY
jgi:hypothetical protein